MMRICVIALVAAGVAGCSGNDPAPATPPPDAPSDAAPDVPGAPHDEAPWRSEALSAQDVAPVYIAEWRDAENRASCALIAFTDGAIRREATLRAASFSGGWGVAYDLPGQRSAFGIAGTGVTPSEDTYDDWPFNRTWSDGSSVGYGPEGGSGPNQLAYLRIAGQDCLYNVWSRLGRAHLEELLGTIRFVEM